MRAKNVGNIICSDIYVNSSSLSPEPVLSSFRGSQLWLVGRVCFLQAVVVQGKMPNLCVLVWWVGGGGLGAKVSSKLTQSRT